MKNKRKRPGGRYLPNPRENWGPGSRAHAGKKRKVAAEETEQCEEVS